MHTRPYHQPTGKIAALPSQSYIPRALPRRLTSWQLFVFTVVVILWLINAASAAVGPVALTYWTLGCVSFFLPGVLATAQLGALLPHDGALYLWTYHAFAVHAGRRTRSSLFWSFFVGACSWVVGPLALVIGASAIYTYLQGMLTAGWLASALALPWVQGLVMLALILLCHLIALQRFAVVSHLVTFAFGFDLLALTLLAVGGARWLLSQHASVTVFTHLSDWQPTPASYGLFALISLGYLGISIPLNMGGELSPTCRPERSLPRALWWGACLVYAGYIVSTLVVLVIKGAALANSANANYGLVTMIDGVLGKLAGNLLILCLIPFFLLSVVVYHLASSRLLLVGSLDGRLPAWTGRLSRQRVPTNALWVQCLLALGLTAVIYVLIPAFASVGQAAALASDVYNVVLASLTLISVFANLFLYLDLFLLTRAGALIGKLVLPPALLWASLILGPLASLLVLADALLFSWTPLLSNGQWSFCILALLLILLLVLSIASLLASSEASWQSWAELPETSARP